MIELPIRTGFLSVTGDSELYYEDVGNPEGPAVLYLHGGPGSGSGTGHRRRIDPARQRSITFDQRGCGRSRPLVTDSLHRLDENTTPALIEDIEALRRHLRIDRWMVTGASWGSTLALAYAQAHPDRVMGLGLFVVVTTSTAEVEWVTEDMGRVFPEAWEAFARAVDRDPGERVVDAYARALRHPDAAVRARAAAAWGQWEDTHVSLGPGWKPDPRWHEPPTRDVLATLVTHYWSNSGFGGDDILGQMHRLHDIPGVLVHGRRDISAPAATAWELHKAWPGSELTILDEGHGGPESAGLLKRAIVAMAS